MIVFAAHRANGRVRGFADPDCTLSDLRAAQRDLDREIAKRCLMRTGSPAMGHVKRRPLIGKLWRLRH